MTTSPSAGQTQPGMAAQPSAPPSGQPGVSGPVTAPKQQPGTAEENFAATQNVTAVSEAEVKKGGLSSEIVGIKPQVGWLNFRNGSSGFEGRALYGFSFDFNVSNAFSKTGNSPLFIGPSTGYFFSHIGAIGDNFFGSNTALIGGDPGANLFFLPLDLKVGGTAGPFRLAIHGGGNVIYQSIPGTVVLGIHPAASSWTMLPNLGADVEVGSSNVLAFIARPDWTISGPNRMFALTVGLSFPLA